MLSHVSALAANADSWKQDLKYFAFILQIIQKDRCGMLFWYKQLSCITIKDFTGVSPISNIYFGRFLSWMFFR